MMKRIFILTILLVTLNACSGLDLTGAAAPENVGSESDKIVFISDVTVPDFTVLQPGESFTKTWRLQNSGITTWTSAYQLVFRSGDRMGAAQAVFLHEEVQPGDSIDLSMQMTAPQEEGKYTGNWMLRTPDGTFFGLGEGGDEPFYVSISVVNPNNAGAPAPAEGNAVTRIDFKVKQDNYSGACPTSLHFDGTIYFQGTGSVVYELEAESGTPNFTFRLPDASTHAFDATGAQRFDFSYDLEIENSMTGWLRLHTLSPNSFRSEKVMMTVKCQ